MQPVILLAVLSSVVALVSAGVGGGRDHHGSATGGYGYQQASRNQVHGDHHEDSIGGYGYSQGSSLHEHDHQNYLLQEHHNHIKIIRDFPCHGPQKRIMSIKEVIPVQDTYSKTFFPDVTVLHHCDHLCGSCPPGKVCAALQSTQVKRVFQVTFQKDVGVHKRGDSAYELYELPEHSHCHCVDIHRHGTESVHHQGTDSIHHQGTDSVHHQGTDSIHHQGTDSIHHQSSGIYH